MPKITARWEIPTSKMFTFKGYLPAHEVLNAEQKGEGQVLVAVKIDQFEAKQLDLPEWAERVK